MKLDSIERMDLITAASEMDKDSFSEWSEYWVQFENGREYQFKHITRRAYEIATGEKVDKDFFQSNEYYRSFIERKFGYKIIYKVPDNVAFFTEDNLLHFAKYAGEEYKKGNVKHENAGKIIKANIFNKTNIWVKSLNLDEWQFKLDNTWQIAGRFKKYSWIRLFRTRDKNPKVFFTLGVDGKEKSLFYKLDFQQSQNLASAALTADQIKVFERIINGTSAEWSAISIDNLPNYDWEKLRQTTIDFIGRYESLYDEAIRAIQTEIKTETISIGEETPEPLIEFPIPSRAFNSLPEKEYSFKGVDIDYDAENVNSKIIGEGGEKLVLEKEKKFLIANGHSDLAEKVKKTKDGEGYDILSFDINRDKKFIEVKTTTGISTSPFIMTDNEWAFMKQYPDQYHLYRIYEYNKETKSGKLFCLSGNLEQKVFTRQKQIEVFLKTDDSI